MADMSAYAEFLNDKLNQGFSDPYSEFIKLLASRKLREGIVGGDFAGVPRAIVNPSIPSGNRVMDPRQAAAILMHEGGR